MSDNPTLNFTVPQPQVPFVSADGRISREWLYYMVGLWRRTGGAHGIPAANLQDQINALAVETSFADLAEPQMPVAFSVMLADAIEVMPTALPINPFIVAMMVSD